MSAACKEEAGTVTANVEFTFWDREVKARIPVPAGSATPADLLPTGRSLAELIVGIAKQEAEVQGHSISCRAGCGACCRQLVPISEPEARIIRRIVDELPEPRRTQVLARFRAARDKISATGMLDELGDKERFPYHDIRNFSLKYFRLGIPCPFLENESCSIYEERPVVCREYLVVSPAENCASPSAQTIQMVPLPAKVSAAMVRLSLRPGERAVRWVPLTLALDWADSHPENDPERTGPELLQELFARLAERRDKPEQPPASEAAMSGSSL